MNNLWTNAGCKGMRVWEEYRLEPCKRQGPPVFGLSMACKHVSPAFFSLVLGEGESPTSDHTGIKWTWFVRWNSCWPRGSNGLGAWFLRCQWITVWPWANFSTGSKCLGLDVLYGPFQLLLLISFFIQELIKYFLSFLDPFNLPKYYLQVCCLFCVVWSPVLEIQQETITIPV